MNLTDALLDFIFPPHCPVCDEYVKHKGLWCEECLRKVEAVRRLPADAETFAVLDGIWALGRYSEGLRTLLLQLKFNMKRDRLAYLHTFLDRAGEKLSNEIKGASVAIPVPLHEEREKTRGFNQTELIFRQWALEKGLSWQRAVVRIRSTVPQFGLGAEERRKNLSGAFSVAARADVCGKSVLLLDDICTTGATLRECAKVLRGAGAKRVYGLVLSSDRD